MPGSWSGIFVGSTRTVECPNCRRKQAVPRRPTPFEVTCKECRRSFKVTDAGVTSPKGR